jgi:hypothetical protein
MIIDLLALLMILGACAAAGIIFAIRRREHEAAEQRADELRVADQQELYAAMARVHAHSREPFGVDPHDRLPI